MIRMPETALFSHSLTQQSAETCRWLLLAMLISCGLPQSAGFAAELARVELSEAVDSAWQRIEVDPEFRAEGVAVGDFNRDGKLDIAAGDVWYAAPDWKLHEVRPVGKYDGSKWYSNCFVAFAADVNQDGWDDLILIGFPGDPFHWYENPKNQPGHWAKHEIWHSACNESPLFTDITGDGRPEIILGSQPEQQMGYLELPPAERARDKWAFRAISEPGDPNSNGTFKYYHGLGAGDLNQDGRTDVVIPHGWWEQPEKLTAAPWKFHPLQLSKAPGEAPLPASNIQVVDLDLDGDHDLVMSSAHGYGVWWFENIGTSTAPEFAFRLIDESFSQTHALWMGPLRADGQVAFVTGKRYFAHMGPDPGEFDPVVMNWFEAHRTAGKPPQITRHSIPAGADTGVGTQFQVIDLDQDGHLDVVLSNKKGVNVLRQVPAK